MRVDVEQRSQGGLHVAPPRPDVSQIRDAAQDIRLTADRVRNFQCASRVPLCAVQITAMEICEAQVIEVHGQPPLIASLACQDQVLAEIHGRLGMVAEL